MLASLKTSFAARNEGEIGGGWTRSGRMRLRSCSPNAKFEVQGGFCKVSPELSRCDRYILRFLECGE